MDRDERQRQLIKRLCDRFGVQIVRTGRLLHLRGYGVDLSTVDLAHVSEVEVRRAWLRLPAERM